MSVKIMDPQIASLANRMAQGGDWRSFRDEISELQSHARTQDEYVVLLEAYEKLVAVGPTIYDDGTWAKLSPLVGSEYLTFLNKEAMEGGQLLNPVMLDHVTRREVEAGRLSPDDRLRRLGEAGASVLGDASSVMTGSRTEVNWLAGGLSILGLIMWIIEIREPVSPLWLIPVGFILGWLVNERSRKHAIAAARQKRLERGYPALD